MIKREIFVRNFIFNGTLYYFTQNCKYFVYPLKTRPDFMSGQVAIGDRRIVIVILFTILICRGHSLLTGISNVSNRLACPPEADKPAGRVYPAINI